MIVFFYKTFQLEEASMEDGAGQKGIVAVATLPFKGVDITGKAQDALVVLPGLLVGEDRLVLRMKGGIVVRSLKEMRKEPGFNVDYLDFPTKVVPPNMLENFEIRLERLVELLSLDLLEDLLTAHKSESPSIQDEALRAAEGPSGLPGVYEEEPYLRGVMQEG